MKSDFSRFLHHTLSHSDVKPQSTPMLSYSGLTRISRWNKFATWFDLDTPVKPECDTMGANTTTYRGRSMVEMLGVLAIIGVLSVGAIAGYSKAMFKYKLNKHAESFNLLLNEAIKAYPDLRRYYGSAERDTTNLNTFFYKTGSLPDGVTYNNSNGEITDVLKNKYYLRYATGKRSDGSNFPYYYIETWFNRSGNKMTDHDREICRNFALVTKENAANIHSFVVRSISSEAMDYTDQTLYGDTSHQTTNLLRNASIAQIDKICNSCDSSIGCAMVLYITVEY